MGTNCAPLVADLFYTASKEMSWISLTMTINPMLLRLLIRLPCTTINFRTFTTHILKVRTLIVNQIYPPELQLKKSNPTDTEASF